jgi:hypothetical protein
MKALFMSLQADHIAVETGDSADITLLRPSQAGYELSLRVVRLEQVVPHEHYHEPRVTTLAARLVREGKLINPPIAVQRGDQYVVLDGATRLTALRQLGYTYVIVQVVDLTEQQVQLTHWNHVVYGGSVESLLAVLRQVPGLTLAQMTDADLIDQELPHGALGCLITADKRGFLLEAHAGSGTDANRGLGWLRVLNDVVEAYGQWGNVERTLSSDMDALASQFADLAALVIFPRFSPETIFALADQGRTVPAGITRFVIPGRILRLNAPLAKLAADEPLAAKQAWLDSLIRGKLRDRKVRYYEEPVVLLDE